QPRLQPSANPAQIRHGSNTTMAKNNRGRTISVKGHITSNTSLSLSLLSNAQPWPVSG
ncbi:hypothetical protein IRJ41_012280, partial [Triplophysa rosa]